MRDANIKKLVLAALMAALTYVATSIVQIPSPMQGYVNLGDCIVLLSGWILGPWWGAAAGGIGSMLVDLLGSYGHYAPGTLIIKGCMALVAALIVKAMKESKASYVISAVVSEAIMVLGYFVFEDFILGYGAAAAAEIPGNAAQAAVGIVGGLALYFALSKVPQIRDFSEAALAKKQK